ncbi:ATP-grasp domain-containing protein [Peribacillus saganii]|uniref:ATP-grasp domain-containing protein n=1 Tax=Peribacillus saganii TaxID=2303992 RepID=A0A372LTP4_9BACI|nr:ATP-grasp domain-containing protein [Peribacillus saganii]RFU71563.1 ATP-grasp domain-containing protein [Peribacillus saganii]
MKTGWLIYNSIDAESNKAYIQWMLDEAKRADIKLEFLLRDRLTIGHLNLSLTVLYDGEPISYPDFAIVRTIDPLFTRQLEMIGIRTFNSSIVSEICNNKAKTHQFLSPLGIPMADTIFYHGEKLDQLAFPFPYPFIVKEVHGRGGKRVYMIKSEDDIRKIEHLRGTWLLQKPAVFGKDIRIFVIGQKIIAAVLRQSDIDFKSNYTLGGRAAIYKLSKSEIALAEKIIAAFDFGMVGIDFVFHEDGSLLLNEIEDVVGSRTLSALTDLNIVREYLTFIKKTI